MSNESPIVHFRMPKDEVEELHRLAQRLKISRTQLIKNLIRSGLDDLHFSEKLGVVSLVGFLRKQKINPDEVFDFVVEKRFESSTR